MHRLTIFLESLVARVNAVIDRKRRIVGLLLNVWFVTGITAISWFVTNLNLAPTWVLFALWFPLVGGMAYIAGYVISGWMLDDG